MLNDLMQHLAVRREQGQTMVEYGLILALISVVAVAILILVGGDVVSVFTSIHNDL